MKAYRMSRIPNINPHSIQRATHIFCTEAISYRANLLKALLLQILNPSLYRGVDLVLGMVGAPGHEIETRWTVQGECIASEYVNDDRVVAIRGELVRDKLAVLPNSDYVGDEENCRVFVDFFAHGFGDVGINANVELDYGASRLAPAEVF